ncbi:single-stranded-DNA-specific exonuclease RecJ [bacterium]|nr:single-stranded-DNA-specific exonuclease RecJ [bacterium]
MAKKWIFKAEEYINNPELDEVTGSRVLSTLLANRGITDLNSAKAFLNPISDKVSSPFNFADMEKAVERIKQAVDNKEKITIYGDFDADGITSTSLLYLTLKRIGADVGFYIPDRDTDGHGLNMKALNKFISGFQKKLIITVDCGISNVSEVALAKTFKADVIITDHHEAQETLPDAYAVINPKAPDSLIENLDFETIESLNCLAGVGVAFKLACALLEKYDDEEFAKELLPLVAVGTVGDIVPLVKENRCLVTSGLELIRQGAHFGLTKLVENIKIPLKTLTSENISFGIVPRINATGRLDSPLLAFELLVSKDEEKINECVEKLNELNEERQNLCDETFKEAVQMISKTPNLFKKSIVLYSPDWHIGIIGIVASKLIEKYHLPTFLMTKDSHEEGRIRCSCRSIKGINVFEILSLMGEKFLNFGGHKMAGGFSFDSKIYPFEVIRNEINKIIDAQDFDFSPTLDIDMLLEPQDLSLNLVNEIEKLQPFGAENQPPVFAMKDLSLKNLKFMGVDSNHLKMYLETPLNNIVECVKWNTPKFNVPLNSKLDIAFEPKINEYNGNTTLQLDVCDVHSEFLKEEEEKQVQHTLKIFDHRKKTDIFSQVMKYLSETKLSTGIFAVNKDTTALFDEFEDVKNKLFSVQNIPQNLDQIMLFDCPDDEEELKELINRSGAKRVQFMNFNSQGLNSKDFISKLSSMMKFCVNNKNGEFDIYSLMKSLPAGEETVKLALVLLEQVEMISLESEDEINYKVSFVKPVKFSDIEQENLYSELENRINEINSFRKRLYNASVDELHTICGG